MSAYYILSMILDNKSKIVHNSSLPNENALDLIRGRVTTKDLAFNATKGFEKHDFLATGVPGILLCSSRIVALFKEHGIKGWFSTEVNIISSTNKISEEYHLLHVGARSNSIDYSRSELIGKSTNSFVELKGRFVDENTITEDDIFVPDKTVMTFVNQKTAKLLDHLQSLNIMLTPNHDYIGEVPTQIYQSSL